MDKIARAEIDRLERMIAVRDRGGKMLLDQLDRVCKQNDRLREEIAELKMKLKAQPQ